MPWKENRTVDLRVQLIQDYQQGESIAGLAEMYQVARKTIYKWLERYESEGAAGLQDRSRKPEHSPTRLADGIVASIVAARQRWGWGPRKLRAKLTEQQPEIEWPAPSTIGEVLQRAGLTAARKVRVRMPVREQPFAAIDAPNQTWCADFKGWFRTGDGTRCDPLTLTDAHTRFLLRCHIVPKTDGVHAAAIFDAAFRQYGLPRVIRTDNGTPFASRAPGGVSRLSIRWIKLGIVPERTRPASPQDNGRHERMHSTLKQATLRPPAGDARRQQRIFDRFRQQFNHERPHEALGQRTPASCYAPSPRAMPRRVAEIEYGPDLIVRRISQQGSLKWNSERTFLSEILAYELVGLRPLDERYWVVLFGPVTLGWMDTFRHRFHRRLSLRLRRQFGLR